MGMSFMRGRTDRLAAPLGLALNFWHLLRDMELSAFWGNRARAERRHIGAPN